MDINIEKHKYGFEITVIPENEKDKNFIENWDFYIEKYREDGKIKLLI